jgi:glc operon protein GlcG
MTNTTRTTWHPGLQAGFLAGALMSALTVSKVWAADKPLSPQVRAALVEPLSLADAKAVVAAAVGFARQNGAPGGAIAVVDAGGLLVYLERLDGTFPAAAAVSTGKARTAALFQKPTSALEKAVNDGRTTMVALPDVTPFTPLQGGLPLTRNGVVIGAIGVSGASSAQQDEEVATAGAAALPAVLVQSR